jgi:hypothetical protein
MYPEILEPLRDRPVVELAKVRRREPVGDAAEVLPALHPMSTRHLKVQPVEPNVRLTTNAEPDSSRAAVQASCDAPVPRDSEQPLTAEISRLHVTVSRRFLAKLEAARDALSYARPGATTEDLLEAGLDLLLERQAKRNGLVDKPRKSAPSSNAVTLTAAVKREVWRRDGGRCQWPIESGGVCGSTRHIQFDHIIPRAAGGLSTVENVRLLCRMHNDLAARRVFGDAWMDRFTGNGTQRMSRSPLLPSGPHASHARAPP